MAFRGYEHFINSNGVKVEANPQRFLGILREILSLPPLSLTEDEKHERRDVLESTLTSLSFELIFKKINIKLFKDY